MMTNYFRKRIILRNLKRKCKTLELPQEFFGGVGGGDILYYYQYVGQFFPTPGARGGSRGHEAIRKEK
jgi:hypothetical protein